MVRLDAYLVHALSVPTKNGTIVEKKWINFEFFIISYLDPLAQLAELTMKGRACSHQAYVTWELPNKTFLFVKIYR